MTTTVSHICAFMDAWAPPGWAYPWDRVGLHSGAPDQPVESVLVCLTVTPEAVSAAKRAGATMIVSHHPLIWEPLKTLCADNPHTRMCLELCQAGIACFSAHTNLDVAPGGVNAALASALKLQETRILFREEHLRQVKLITFVPETHQSDLLNALAAAGAGIIGNYTHCSFNTPGIGTFLPGNDANPFSGDKGRVNEEHEMRLEMIVDKARVPAALKALYAAHPYEEPAYDIVPLQNENSALGLGVTGLLAKKMPFRAFAESVRASLAVSTLRAYGNPRKTVRRIAVMGGSGGDYISRLPAEVDVYVTGDVRYHDAETAALRGVACIDAGHRGTELPIVNEIARRLRKAFPHLTIAAYREKETAFVVSDANSWGDGKASAGSA